MQAEGERVNLAKRARTAEDEQNRLEGLLQDEVRRTKALDHEVQRLEALVAHTGGAGVQRQTQDRQVRDDGAGITKEVEGVDQHARTERRSQIAVGAAFR